MFALNRPIRSRTYSDHRVDVVRLGSTVAIRHLQSGELDVYTIVLPTDADIAHHRISIFTPLGRAIDARRVGETVEFEAPAGTVRIRIEALHPEPLVEMSSV
jgi:transcription elongation GreA/GreB family factor